MRVAKIIGHIKLLITLIDRYTLKDRYIGEADLFHWFMAAFMYCTPNSYCISNFCISNKICSFLLLKAKAKSKGKLIAIIFKSQEEQQLLLLQ